MRHEFGGDWTETKLGCIEHYLQAWSTVLKDKGFRRLYIDAFSGTGERYDPRLSKGQTVSFLDEVMPEQIKFFEGSARRAIRVQPEIDIFALIEKSRRKFLKLNELRSEFPARDIHTFQGDANDVLRRICKNAKWDGDEKGLSPLRAVLFLDPFGCQVEWPTIEQIAATGKIDMWYLFPSGQGINRLVARSGEIPVGWRSRIEKTLGTADWESSFLQKQEAPDLFTGTQTRHSKIAGPIEIEQFFIDRLRSVFPHVAQRALPIENSAGYRMFSLCFASANPGKGGQIAVKIANDLIRNWSARKR